MTKNVTLRTRAAILFTVLGIFLSLSFAALVFAIADSYENVIEKSFLEGQVRDYALRLKTEPASILPKTRQLRGYLLSEKGSGDVPAFIIGKAPGFYTLDDEANPDADGISVLATDTDKGRLVFVADISSADAIEDRLHVLVAAIMIVGTVMSAWIGWLLAGRVVRPISRLVEVVESLPVTPLRTDLADMLPDDELGRLGRAIDAYQERLALASDAQQRFFADASHELRTPITVVQGAIELLVEDTLGLPDLHPRVHRLRRAVIEISELLDALLRLARNHIDEAVLVEMSCWLGEAIANSDGIADGAVRVHLECNEIRMQIHRYESHLILSAILRRLLPPGRSGTLSARASLSGINFHFIPDHVGPVSTTGRHRGLSDRRVSPALLGFLAERIGWTISDGDAHDGNVLIHFRHPASRSAPGEAGRGASGEAQ